MGVELVPLLPKEGDPVEPTYVRIVKACLVWASIWAAGMVVLFVGLHYVWRMVRWLISISP